MRKDFSTDYRFEKQAGGRAFGITISPGSGRSLTFSDENTPVPPALEGVDWIATFLVEGSGGDYTLTVDGDLPPGKSDVILYCLVNDKWIERPGNNRRWSLPPGDPAVGIR